MSTDDIARIDIEEFRAAGYLQELNRRFLHPLGLALEVVVPKDGPERLGGVWDYRDDPEGIRYGELDSPEELDRAQHVDDVWEVTARARRAELGYVIQPIEGARNLDDDRLLSDILRRILGTEPFTTTYLELPEPPSEDTPDGVDHLFIEGGLMLSRAESEAVLRARPPA